MRKTLAPPNIDRRKPPLYLGIMSGVTIVAATIGVFLLVYLVYSIVRPEKF
jgi:K+-transporting ATPase KdpF subunit